MKLKCTKRTIYEIDIDDLEEFLIKNFKISKDYQFRENNDSNQNSFVEFEIGDYKMTDKVCEEIIKEAEEDDFINEEDLLNAAYHKGLIKEKGTYFVDASW